MEVRQLQYFVAVAEELSFTRAAERHFVAQSGISAQIGQLERELGQPLFERSSRSVRLTEAGSRILPIARTALSTLDAIRLTVDELVGLCRGRVTIGTVSSISSPTLDLPGLLAGFHNDYPGVEITLVEDATEALLTAIRAGTIDLAFIGLNEPAPPGVTVHEVISERLVAAVAPGDALATRKTLEWSALNDRALIVPARGTGLRTQLDGALATHGLRNNITFEASDPALLADFASRGLGVAVVPTSAVTHFNGTLTGIPLVRPALHGRICAAWAAVTPSPATSALIDRVRRSVQPRRSGPGRTPSAGPSHADARATVATNGS